MIKLRKKHLISVSLLHGWMSWRLPEELTCKPQQAVLVQRQQRRPKSWCCHPHVSQMRMECSVWSSPNITHGARTFGLICLQNVLIVLFWQTHMALRKLFRCSLVFFCWWTQGQLSRCYLGVPCDCYTSCSWCGLCWLTTPGEGNYGVECSIHLAFSWSFVTLCSLMSIKCSSKILRSHVTLKHDTLLQTCVQTPFSLL